MAQPTDTLDENKLTPEDEQVIENHTENELLKTLGEEFSTYYNHNKNALSGSTTQEIFFQFLKQEGSNDKQKIIEDLESKLGRELKFDDIKNLYLKSGYTIEKTLVKDIFKTFKRKNAVKSVIRQMETKINQQLSSENFGNIDFGKFLNIEINTEKDVNNLFEDAKVEFYKILKMIKDTINSGRVDENKKIELEKLLISLKNIIITNEDILEQLKIDNIITDDESKFLNGDNTITGLNNQQKDELNNIFTTLFNSSIITSMSDFTDTMEKVKLNFEQFKDLGKLENTVNPLLEAIDENDIDYIYNKIENILTDEEIDEMVKCGQLNGANPIKLCEDRNKKQLVMKYLHEDLKLLADFVDRKDAQLANIIYKIENNQVLDITDVTYLFNKMKDEYIENIMNFIEPAFRLDASQKQTYIIFLESLFNTSSDKVNLIGQEILVEKQLELPTHIDDFFNEAPRYKLNIKGDDIDIFQEVFSEYFIDLEIGGTNRKISKHSKIRLSTNLGSEEGYLNENDEGKIEVYTDITDVNPKETFEKNEINNIIELEKQLVLENSDIPNLLMSSISRFPDKNYQYDMMNIEENSASIPEVETEEEKQERMREFNREWNKLEGDDRLTKPKVGNILQVKGTAVNIPGMLNNWYYAEITDIDNESGIMKLKIGGGFLNFDSGPMTYDISMDAKTLRNMKYNVNGYLFKFDKKDDIQDFAEYTQDLQLSSDFGGMKGTLSKWQNGNLKIIDGKLAKKNEEGKYETITHIGRSKVNEPNNNEIIKGAKYRTDLYDVWEIEYKDDKVILKTPETDSKKEMDLNTFMITFLQNDLYPWSEKEYMTTKNNYEQTAEKQKPKIWYALNDIILASKNIKDAFLYHFKQDDELRAAMMYENLVKMMPGVWFLKDIKLEASGEKESKIWKVIEEAKSRLERTGEGKGENHGKKAAEVIESEIFKPVMKGKELSTRKKMKAAGYLLYALEKGPGAYFRKLGPYAGQGVRVKALLGEAHYKKWKLRARELQDILNNDPTNEDARQNLVLSEMYYIKEADTKDMYSAKFGPTVEGLAMEAADSPEKANNTLKSERAKGSFDLIYSGLKAHVGNSRHTTAMGALKALAERTETQPNYINYNKAITSLIFTGYLYNEWGTQLKEDFDKLCKTYSTPIGLFAKQKNGINKVLNIFDYIVKQKNINPGGKKQSFTKYLYGTDDVDKINIFELNNSSIRQDIFKKMDNFWAEYGEEMVSALDYSDTSLLSYLQNNEIDKKRKNHIDEYFSMVNSPSKSEDFEISNATFKTAYAPYYQAGILNMSSAAFGKFALEIDEGSFQNDIGPGIWEGLTMKLEKISDFMYENEGYEFILSKFITLLGRYYSNDTKMKLIQALRSGDIGLLKEIIYKHLKYAIGGHYGLIPPEMEEGLEKLSQVFSIRPKNIENILKNNFTEKEIIDSYIPIMNEEPVNRHDYHQDNENIA